MKFFTLALTAASAVFVLGSSLFDVSDALEDRSWHKQRNPYEPWARKSKRKDLALDLGYERYAGHTVGSLNVWKGVRFGATTAGENRFQAPKVPKNNRNTLLPAQDGASACLQYLGGDYGSEDCLFLNIHAPKNAHNLPVFVYIHGGAYQLGSANTELDDFVNNNDGRFIAISIQYRLSVFGFLSSEDVKKQGQLNAGLLDMELALQWVQNYAHVLGGDRRRVTIAGESAGAGAVMQLSMLRGGRLGESLFRQSIASSPYLPTQSEYDADVITGYYDGVANQTGCAEAANKFDCLVGVNASALNTAANKINQDTALYTRGFAPIVDGEIIEEIPSQQLLKKRVNGKRTLVGNNANEGVTFVPLFAFTTNEQSEKYIREYYRLFTPNDFERLFKLYPSFGDTDPHRYNFATSGVKAPTALEISTWSNGEQQRVANMQAESLFVCPAYWLTEAYPVGWKYEFTVPPSLHSIDTGAIFTANQDHPMYTDDFALAFQAIWGNFVVQGDPRISWDLSCGNCTYKQTHATNLDHWTPYSRLNPVHMSANVTGGHVGPYNLFLLNANITVGPGIMNQMYVANADTWEGGRGYRCASLRALGPRIPG